VVKFCTWVGYINSSNRMTKVWLWSVVTWLLGYLFCMWSHQLLRQVLQYHFWN